MLGSFPRARLAVRDATLETPMIKLTYCLRRLPHLSLEEFQKYWLETHGPLVRRHARALGIRRYVQLHSLDSPLNAGIRESRAAPEGFDGVAQLWWNSLEDLVRAGATPEGQEAAAALLEDERRFIDLEGSPLWLGHEETIIGE
jgi:uncharacterized protein (TIGR02118 family)